MIFSLTKSIHLSAPDCLPNKPLSVTETVWCILRTFHGNRQNLPPKIDLARQAYFTETVNAFILT